MAYQIILRVGFIGWQKTRQLIGFKREQKKYAVYQEYKIPESLQKDDLSLNDGIQDSMLKMILACCHP